MNSNPNNERHLPTVYVGIPAHNEAKHIARLLDSIISQNHENFSLSAVTVACDGCTDSTAEVVGKYMQKNPVVQIINDNLRVGKVGRMNNFFKIADTDIFVSFDSDIVLANNNVLSNLVETFAIPKVGLVGGLGIPFPVKKLASKIAAVSDELWYEVRKDLDGGNNIHNLVGCVLALSKNFYQGLAVPKNVTPEDEYLFFAAKVAGFEFRFAKDAKVYYWSPSNFKDLFRQSARFISTKTQIQNLFGPEVSKFYAVPMANKVRAIIQIGFREPVYLPLALSIQILLRLFKGQFQENNNKGLWTRITNE
jgi:cellulose synthase/poly-beta-1,6-N-acetylglucosamine synthase-like glycosyltransferase